jgi:hypothetical protein
MATHVLAALAGTSLRRQPKRMRLKINQRCLL